jgi:predicted neutral ceramidase superfamily lipid hydrolase
MSGKKLHRLRNFIVIFIYFLFALWSVRNALFEGVQPVDIAISLALSAAMVKFCIVDSICRGGLLLNSFHWIIFFTWPVSVPIYLLWTRGIKGVLWAVLNIVMLIVVYSVVFVMTSYLAWGDSWLP